MATELTMADGVNAHRASYQFGSATGAAAIDHTLLVPAGTIFRVRRITLKFSAAPAAAENFSVTIDSHLGVTYDSVPYSADMAGVASVVLTSENFGILEMWPGEALALAYTNTNTRTWGLTVIVEEM